LHPEAKKTTPNTLTTELRYSVTHNGNVTNALPLVKPLTNTGSMPSFLAGPAAPDDLMMMIVITIAANDSLATMAQNIAKTSSGFATTSVTPGQ
jgi:hypothetical protein